MTKAFADLKVVSRSINPPQWDDSQQSAIALKDAGVNVPVLTQLGATGIYFPKFTVGDFLVFCHQFPHGLQEAAIVSVSPHVHWISSTTSANAVRWELTYQWVNNGEVLGVSTVITTDALPRAYEFQLADFVNQDKAGAKISSLFTGRLRRITNGAVDYAGDVFMDFFDIHFKKDSIGSNNELSK